MEKNYYEILEVSNDATPLEVKKAYRKLALKYHPDRNLQGNVQDAKIRFQQVGEAYHCLSDPTQRAAYDRERLHYDQKSPRNAAYYSSHPGTTTSTTTSATTTTTPSRRRRPPPPPFDPYHQFDHLFQSDPFFQEAFRDVEVAFAERFTTKTNGSNQTSPTSINNNAKTNATTTTTTTKNNHKTTNNEGWVPWLLRQCGVQFTMTSVIHDGQGGVTASHVSSSPRPQQRGATTTTTTKQTQSYVDRQGRTVTIRRMQQHGNELQDTLINGALVERKVNGVLEDQQQQQQQQQQDQIHQ